MRRVNFLFVFGGAAAIAIVLVLFRVFQQTHTPRIFSMPGIPSPTPLVEASPSTTTWASPNGSKTLVMKTMKKVSGVTTYSFFVAPDATTSGKLIYTKTPSSKISMSIPFNTWSPDNKYFFIREVGGAQPDTLVFKASGENFPDGQQFLDINPLFEAKKSGFVMGEVTGWAAPTLLIVNTKAADQATLGPSFWFDISRKSLIRLSTSFQ